MAVAALKLWNSLAILDQVAVVEAAAVVERAEADSRPIESVALSVNRATMLCALLLSIVQLASVPEQSPDHSINLEPLSGFAVKAIFFASDNVRIQFWVLAAQLKIGRAHV